jgi:hypothetical protein
VGEDIQSERLFTGPPHFFNHKNVYFLVRVDDFFSSKDVAYNTPDLLADAVRQRGGLSRNNHPHPEPDANEQSAYALSNAAIIVNTEMFPDVIRYGDKIQEMKCERAVQVFLNQGGRTGFVGATDTHEGKPAARTAVLVRELTRAAIFDALRPRRNYAITSVRIRLDSRINGHVMGEEIEAEGSPQITGRAGHRPD